MVTRAQIDRIANPHRSAGAKIRPCRGCLAQSGETAEEALERHYLTCPADRSAGQTYILSWLEN